MIGRTSTFHARSGLRVIEGGLADPLPDDDPADVLGADAERCRAMNRTRLLADWVGAGRELTSEGMLGQLDVLEAGRLLRLPRHLGSRIPEQRDHAELPKLWWTAIGTGFLRIADGRAYPGPELRIWTGGTRAERLAIWERAFRHRAGLDQAPGSTPEGSAALIALRLLYEGIDGSPFEVDDLVRTVDQVLYAMPFHADDAEPDDGLVLLDDFGALDVHGNRVALSRLGRHLGDTVLTPAY